MSTRNEEGPDIFLILIVICLFFALVSCGQSQPPAADRPTVSIEHIYNACDRMDIEGADCIVCVRNSNSVSVSCDWSSAACTRQPGVI